MKRTLLLILLMVINSHIFSEKYYEEELVHTFKYGKGDNELGVEPYAPSDGGPGAFAITDDGKFIISDVVNNRVIYYNEDFSVHKIYTSGSIAVMYGHEFVDTKYFLWGIYDNHRIYIYNKTNGNGHIILLNKSILLPGSVLPTDRVMFYYDKYGNLNSYVIEDIKNVVYSRYDEDETMELFENKDYGVDSLYLDDQQRIFNNDHEIQSRSYEMLYEYWKELHKEKNIEPVYNIEGVPPFSDLEIIKSYVKYVGKDKENNTYWFLTQSCIIFNKDGIPIDYFFLKDFPSSSLVVNSKGDIFFRRASFEKKEFYIYRIKRQW